MPAAGKHAYTEKPVADSLEGALRLAAAARAAGITHGVVQDKLFLPGMRKLQRLIRAGFFGRVLSIRQEFGYWVFEGDSVAAQRPSWNYRKEDGGGIVLDMFLHWQHRVSTPMPVWNPDLPDPINYLAQRTDIPDDGPLGNGFKIQWELFLKAAAQGQPFPWDLTEGAKGVQVAQLARQSSQTGRRVEVPRL